MRELSKMKDNSVIVSLFERSTSSSISSSTCTYSSIEYGKNIWIEQNVDVHGIVNNNLKLTKTKGNYVLILALKDELLKSDINTVIVQSTFHQSDNYVPSGYVLLFYAMLDRTKNDSMTWENEHLKICLDCKPNTITDKTKHVNSNGTIYTFGNRANYGMVNGSSITQYATKKYTNELKNKATTIAAK